MNSIETSVLESPSGTAKESARAEPSRSESQERDDIRTRRPLWTAIALGISISVAVLAGWFTFYGLVLTSVVEHGTQFRLYGQLRSELAQETAPLGGAIKPGVPVALLNIRALGLRNAVVVEGTNSQQLTKGPGHLADTPLPGQPGVSAIFGRSTTFGGPFSGLPSLRKGERITITTAQGTFVFRVDRIRRKGSPARPKVLPGVAEITLVSSEGAGWGSGWAPNRTLLADATMVKGQLQAAPAGLPASVARTSQPMQGMTPALVPLMFWLLGLLLVPPLAVWAWRRWGRWQTWVAGIPIVVALLWGATMSAQLLLPNLI